MPGPVMRTILVVAYSSNTAERPARIIVKEVPRDVPNGQHAASQDKPQPQPHADVKPEGLSSQAQQPPRVNHNQPISERTPAVKPVNGEANTSAWVWWLAVDLVDLDMHTGAPGDSQTGLHHHLA